MTRTGIYITGFTIAKWPKSLWKYSYCCMRERINILLSHVTSHGEILCFTYSGYAKSGHIKGDNSFKVSRTRSFVPKLSSGTLGKNIMKYSRAVCNEKMDKNNCRISCWSVRNVLALHCLGGLPCFKGPQFEIFCSWVPCLSVWHSGFNTVASVNHQRLGEGAQDTSRFLGEKIHFLPHYAFQIRLWKIYDQCGLSRCWMRSEQKGGVLLRKRLAFVLCISLPH